MSEQPTKLDALVQPLPAPDTYEFPWMPAYIDDDQALAATLTTLEFGALGRLKLHAWKQSPRCSLPDSDARLAVIAGVSVETWRDDVGPALREHLTPIEGGRVMLMGLRRRFLEQVEKHVSYSLRGRKGGRPAKAGGKQSPNHSDKLRESSGLAQVPDSFVPSKDLSSVVEGDPKNLEREKLSETPAFQRLAIDPSAIAAWRAAHPDEVPALEARARADWNVAPGQAVTPRKAELLAATVDVLIGQRLKADAQTSGPAVPPPDSPYREVSHDAAAGRGDGARG